MTFPVNSTGTETKQIKRVCAVLQRTDAAKVIDYGAVFNCRKIDGSSEWSQHAWGNAVDLFPRGPIETHASARKKIAQTVVWQATHRTEANRLFRLDVAEVIDHSGRKIWTPERGWHAYNGAYGDHVHVSGKPLRTGTPPCAQ